jgi:cation transport ATPase
VVLLLDDVSRVADGIALGQRMLRIARQGIRFGLGASIVLMVIASFGLIAPALGAILQEVIDIVVIFNALRVR